VPIRSHPLLPTATFLSAFLLLAPLAAAAADRAPCQGMLSGAVKGAFACEVRTVTTQEGRPAFTIVARDAVTDVPTYQPGSFELPGAPEARTYTLGDLGQGVASVAREGGALYVASKTSGQRGEVTLTLRSVRAVPGEPPAWIVHGSYRARLLPAGAGKSGEVLVDVTF
jgi:hypothetical protein